MNEKKARILIVDDEEPILHMLSRFFSRHPELDYVTVTRGYKAIEVALKSRFDALLCDIDMPDMSGLDVVKEMKARRICPNLVIYISGAVRISPKVGENIYFIRKPFHPNQVYHLISRIMSTSSINGAVGLR